MPRIPKYDLVSIEDLSIGEIERIFTLADTFAAALERGQNLTLASGLVMATLFYEPSTRTRLSFESAMHRLGGAVISSADMHASSAAKGESLADTVRVVSAYADLLVVRHPNDGAARVAAEYAAAPVINAGDGSREHPTQTLCDLYILRRKKGRLKGLTVAICGDLKFGRTVHSLIYALARFGANIVTVPYGGMGVPEYVLERIAAEHDYAPSSITFDELRSKSGALDALYLTPSGPHQMALFTGDDLLVKVSVAAPTALDAFYVTRLQRERFADKDDAAGAYVHFDARALRSSRAQEAVVLHPLPRTDELAYEFDKDPRAIYFEQAAAGVPVRMALIVWMLETAQRERPPAARETLIAFKHEAAPRCVNAGCISRHEPAYLSPRFRLARAADRSVLAIRCDLCERELRAEYVGHATAHRYYHFDENLYGYVQQWIAEGSLAVFETVKEAEERGYEPYKRGPQRELMNAAEIEQACQTMADQIVAGVADPAQLAIVGVISRGAILAMRLRELVQARTGVRPACAAVDVYASDAGLRRIEDSGGRFIVDGRAIVLVDDVINSGWTVQRAMTALWRHGRPASVQLAVLIDRGHRAVPIRPNYIGKSIPTAQTERVQVRLKAAGADGRKLADRVVIYSMVEPFTEARAVR
ncbi:MAG TPA: aspartate carbamoyltransferase catalytic subunit [Candidatus Binataceae bacterium]|nr:aspartate carbamoyltransferase catalytic subunit [Candidatus Binataceae bacterium]